MGRRHLRGYAELAAARPGLVELAAVIDLAEDRAQFLAGEAEELLGTRPRAFAALEAALAAVPELAAVDVVTSARSHHELAGAALDAGLHVLVEKPMAVTVRACRQMRAAADRSDRLLSVAENFRRDPIARLAQALLKAGAVGEPRTVLETHTGGGDELFLTPWRHLREEGGLLLDVGVHMADLLLHFLGPVREVFGLARLVETRRRRTAPRGGFYARFAAELPDSVAATAPDAWLATLEFESGVWGQWVQDMAAHGPRGGGTTVFGSEGRLDLPGVRSGTPLSVWRDSRGESLSNDALLEIVPDFALDDLTAQLFGGERMARYEAEFVAADRRLIALEIAELAVAIESDTAVEVGPDEGEAAAALVFGVLESSEVGRSLTLADVSSGVVSAYQDPIDRVLGLLDDR